MITTEKNLYIRIDKSYGLQVETMFTATIIAPSRNQNFQVGDTLIVNKDFVQYDSPNTGYAPEISWYAVIRNGEIVPYDDKIYLIADKDKNKSLTMGSREFLFPENYFGYQAEVTTHDAIVKASPVDYIKPGDKVYCHHHLTDESNERWINGVLYYELNLNQVYCVVSDGNIQCINQWNFIEPMKVESTSSLKMHKFDTDTSEVYGKVVHKDARADHIEPGMEIVFKRDMNYDMFVEGTKYFRIRTDCIVARCEVEEIK